MHGICCIPSFPSFWPTSFVTCDKLIALQNYNYPNSVQVRRCIKMEHTFRLYLLLVFCILYWVLTPLLWFKLQSTEEISTCDQVWLPSYIFWGSAISLFIIIAVMICYCCTRKNVLPQRLENGYAANNADCYRLILILLIFIVYWFILTKLLWVKLEKDGIVHCDRIKFWFPYAFWCIAISVFIIIAAIVFSACCCYRSPKNAALDQTQIKHNQPLPDFNYIDSVTDDDNSFSPPRNRLFVRYSSALSTDELPPILPKRNTLNRSASDGRELECNIPLGSPLYAPTTSILKTEVFLYIDSECPDSETVELDEQ